MMVVMPQTSVIHHTVTPGESLTAIARHYGVDPKAVIDASGFQNPDLIKPGWVLHVPTALVDPPPEPSPTLNIGASISTSPGQTWEEATAAFEEKLGRPIDVARRFSSSFPGEFDSVTPYRIDTGKRERIISFKAGPGLTDEELDRFIASIPADGFDTGVCINHEPDKNGGRVSPEQHNRQAIQLADAIDRSGRSDVYPVIVVMTWWERDAKASTTSAVYFPFGHCHRFKLGMDPYDTSTTREGWEITKPTLDLWRARGGTRWGITETGTKRRGVEGARWITDFGEWIIDEGGEDFLWFHAPNGDNGPWWLTDPEMFEAFAALADAA